MSADAAFKTTPLLRAGIFDPPWGAGRIADNQVVKEIGGLGEAFLGRHQRILMLNGEHIVVAVHAQRADEFLPPLGAVTVAAGAENPGTMLFVGVQLHIKHAGAGQVDGIDLRILGVDVENRIA